MADFVCQHLATREAREEVRIDEVLKSDELRRKLLGEIESLKRIGLDENLFANRQIPTRIPDKRCSNGRLVSVILDRALVLTGAGPGASDIDQNRDSAVASNTLTGLSLYVGLSLHLLLAMPSSRDQE
jgi:hypothetical protein